MTFKQNVDEKVSALMAEQPWLTKTEATREVLKMRKKPYQTKKPDALKLRVAGSVGMGRK